MGCKSNYGAPWDGGAGTGACMLAARDPDRRAARCVSRVLPLSVAALTIVTLFSPSHYSLPCSRHASATTNTTSYTAAQSHQTTAASSMAERGSSDNDGLEVTADPRHHRPPSMAEKKESSPMDSFTVLGKIGRGTFGSVYKVKRSVDDRLYVLKKILLAGMDQKEQVGACAEAHVMAKLRHRSVVRYNESFLHSSSLHSTL